MNIKHKQQNKQQNRQGNKNTKQHPQQTWNNKKSQNKHGGAYPPSIASTSLFPISTKNNPPKQTKQQKAKQQRKQQTTNNKEKPTTNKDTTNKSQNKHPNGNTIAKQFQKTKLTLISSLL